MKRILTKVRLLVLWAALCITGCANMSTGQKKAAWFIGGVLVTGYVISEHEGSGTEDSQWYYCPVPDPLHPPACSYPIK